MNYRHAYHAGNFADCLKHAVLVWALRRLGAKPAGFVVLDTHAGAGAFNLGGEAAGRTGEWRDGIGRLWGDAPPPLADYVAQVTPGARYPGSPLLVRRLLRPQDALMACELHPEEHAALRGLLGGDAQVAIHRRDGYGAIGALLPRAARRGLVLIDPPYERPGEFDRVARALVAARARFPGVLMAWYPIKHRAPVRAFHDTLRARGPKDCVAVELCLREPTDAARLNGCGLVLAAPPHGWDAALPPLADALLGRLATEAGAGAAVFRLTDE